MYIHVYIHIYIYIYTHTHKLCAFLYIRVHTCLCMYINHIYIQACLCINMCTYIHLHHEQALIVRKHPCKNNNTQTTNTRYSRCNTLKHNAQHCDMRQHIYALQENIAHCTTLQHPATHLLAMATPRSVKLNKHIFGCICYHLLKC